VSVGTEIGRPDLGAPSARLRRNLAIIGGLGAVVCGLTVLVTLTGNAPRGQRAAPALAHALIVGIPVFAGLSAWHLRPQSRFGPLLVATGFAWSLTTLAQSDSSFLYSTGRVSLWLIEPAILYLILAFPSGRLVGRVDRALFGAAVAIVALLFLPTAALIESYPVVRPLSGCDTECPPNFFMVLDSTPGFVEPMRTVREVLLVLVFLTVAVRLLDRIRHATRLVRRTVTPVLAAAVVRLGAYVSFLPARRIAPSSAAVDALGWVLLLTLPAIALGFLVGVVRWRLHVADAMERLARSVIAGRDPARLRAAMRTALEDPTLEVAYRMPGARGVWVGPDGQRIDPERAGPRSVTAITNNGGPSVVVVHDPALAEHRDFVTAAASVAQFATENERLTARLRSSLRELEESRMRIVAAADKERRRIERDLHDGAQQRLVALRIKLELADELMTTDPDHAQTLLRETESELDEALEDVRSLARGIYPSLLADQGLREALRAVALRAPLRTSLECKGIGRYPPEVESAVYFSCLEALQNAAKHAPGATAVTLFVAANGELRFEVQDDGAGFDTAQAVNGQGLTSMRDRLAAVGGRLTVRSTPGQGTVVCGSVPTAPGEAGIPADSHARSLSPGAEARDDRVVAVRTKRR